MYTLKYLIEQNIVCLKQGIDLLRDTPDSVYINTEYPVYTSSIGDHFRHCLEHYQCFLNGVGERSIDYDARKRDRRIASERAYAIDVAGAIVDRLGELSCVGAPLRIKMDCGLGEEEGAVWAQSTVERDLQYLQAHTIHHYALIAMILRVQGREPSESFGVAPSTLTFRKTQMQAT